MQGLDPRSTRLLRLAGFLSVLLIAVVVNYLLHGGAAELNPVAQAAQRTAATPGARLRMAITYKVEGSSTTLRGTGTGSLNTSSGRSRMDFTMPIPGQPTLTMEAVGDSRHVYLHSSVLSPELPAGKEWLGMEPLLGHDPEQALGNGGNAKGTLEMLKAVGGNVDELDHQIVGGHQTTRYKATIDLSRAAKIFSEHGETDLASEYEQIVEKLPDPSIPVEVWIDEHGLARLIRMVQKLPTVSGGPTVTMDMRMEFFDFGAHPKVKLPPSSKVFDFTPVLRAELGLANGHNVVPLQPPAGAKPLSVSAFHQRVNGICRTSESELKRLAPTAEPLFRKLKNIDPTALLNGEAKPLLRKVGRWTEDRLYPFGRRWLRNLAGVPPPVQYATKYRRYLQLDARDLEGALAGARLYQLGEFKLPGAEAQKAETKRLKKERQALVSSLGVSVCEKSVDSTGTSANPA